MLLNPLLLILMVLSLLVTYGGVSGVLGRDAANSSVLILFVVVPAVLIILGIALLPFFAFSWLNKGMAKPLVVGISIVGGALYGGIAYAVIANHQGDVLASYQSVVAFFSQQPKLPL